MKLKELRGLYQAINVRFKDDFTLKRAIFYYDFVQQTYDYFTGSEIKEELNQINGGYKRVRPALTESSLLTGLCKILDRYIVAAVNEDLKRTGEQYGEYFEGIFDGYDGGSVPAFFDRYGRTHQALENIVNNFQQNILTACQRVLQDWKDLRRMFVPHYRLRRLIGIESTGSDFHKGGQQVLFLTFRTTGPYRANLRIVYKPSDVEVDCLLIGDTEAVNDVSPDFQAASLMEILNRLMQGKPELASGLYKFPTYKILPRYPGSQLQPNNNGQLPIHDSYGYIEFLEHKQRNSTIYPGQRDICRRFYTLIGQVAAIACVFSLSDLHIENLIVHKYAPHPIDLENSLTRPIKTVSDTEMVFGGLTHLSGINGAYLKVYKYSGDDNSHEIQEEMRYRPGANRLWWDNPRRLVFATDYCNQILNGFETTIRLIRGNDGASVDEWFERLRQGAIVRIIPLGTETFTNTIIATYRPTGEEDIRDKAKQLMEEELSVAYQGWLGQYDAGEDLAPYFLCLQEDYVVDDIVNLDVPVFYHRLNTLDVMDSQGRTVVIPETMMIENEEIDIHTLLGRETYFPYLPLNYVQGVQLIGWMNQGTGEVQIEEFLEQLRTEIQASREIEAYNQIVVGR